MSRALRHDTRVPEPHCPDSYVRDLASYLRRCWRAVMFTGAGISTESGIPDFRSPGGIWSRNAPIDFRSFLASEEARRETWRRKLEIDRDMSRASPNRGHRAVAELVRGGRVLAVVTQNIDGLHQRSGVPDEALIELHGNGTYARCLSCRERYDLDPILRAFETDETLPICARCGGIIKTATISFGQPMPEHEMRRAEAAARACDLFLVVGSSLAVYPAAALPGTAKASGASLVILNRDPTDYDAIADLVLQREIGPTLGAAVDLVSREDPHVQDTGAPSAG